MRQCFPGLGLVTPPVLVDWLPWNHTFGGNHNVGLTLYNGGTLYIDDGKPTPALIHETLRNLREISPTVYFNVPKGFEEIAAHRDGQRRAAARPAVRARQMFLLRRRRASRCGTSCDRLAEATCGERIRISPAWA